MNKRSNLATRIPPGLVRVQLLRILDANYTRFGLSEDVLLGLLKARLMAEPDRAEMIAALENLSRGGMATASHGVWRISAVGRTAAKTL